MNSFSAHRPLAVGRRGLVSAAHPLAAQAGLRALMAGGNAVDAAVATAAALNVVEPQMSGIGGIGWMLIHLAKEKRTRVLNFSGRAPGRIDLSVFDSYQAKWEGIRTAVVPGNPAGWFEAHRTHGARPWKTLFDDAVRFAEEGFPISAHLRGMIELVGSRKLVKWPGAAATYLVDGMTPSEGWILRAPDLGKTLRAYAEGGAEWFYRGEPARRIGEYAHKHGGGLSADDLRDYAARWEEPIETSYHGRVYRTLPPNASAFQILQLLNMLEGDDLPALGHNSADYIHLFIEASKLAVTDRIHFGRDPDRGPVPVKGLLSKAYARELRRKIDMKRAAVVEGDRWNGNRPADALPPGDPLRHDSGLTTHFSVADEAGNVVACTQTNGSIFGSGAVVEGTGILLNNAMYWFEQDAGSASPNVAEPRRRFEMPLAPIQVFEGDRLVLSLGSPGSYGILQTTPQVLFNHFHFGANLQEAIEAPRVKVTEGRTITPEARIPEAVRNELTARGHNVKPYPDWSFEVGGFQGIRVLESGHFLGGADPRRDGAAVGF